ncbi:putative integral membrane protein [Eutypa lata UCREL1]|uniref:Putative integral membrane protein n=1 Tax=Eutypa lata (strain UCR-EL1) TaxID=1287681 RepID=M7SQC9_EUTLA|nr:putative integral membrane protein [Eutypa lata UCREL1]
MAVELEGYPDNLQPWSISVVVAVTVLALLSVGLRLLARWEKRQELWWDDYLIVWSMVWNIIVVGFIGGMIQYGMGIHVEQVPLEDVVMEAKFLLVAEILYVFNLVWTKLAILLMFYRIFRFSYFKKAAIIIGTFIIAWVICITFLFIFICVPVQKVWDTALPGKCINQVGTWIANAASTILSDLAILILPLPRIWQLQLRKADKIALSFAFGLGFL